MRDDHGCVGIEIQVAADAIHRSRVDMERMVTMVRNREQEFSYEVSRLKRSQPVNGGYSAEIAEACQSHKAINVLRKAYEDAEREIYACEVQQNGRTTEMRDYIRDYCGRRGREWYSRLMPRRP